MKYYFITNMLLRRLWSHFEGISKCKLLPISKKCIFISTLFDENFLHCLTNIIIIIINFYQWNSIKHSCWLSTFNHRFSTKSFCQLFKVKGRAYFIKLRRWLDTVQIVYLKLLSIFLYSFSRSMSLVIFPCNFISCPFLNQHTKTLFFISYKVTFVNIGNSFLSPKTIFLILFPTSCVSIPSCLIFINSPTIFSVYSPFTIVNKSIFVSSHSKNCSNPFW